VLEVENITKRFGGLVAVDDVSIQLEDEAIGLMGPNGSGKSTTMNCITGFHEPETGSVRFDGQKLTSKPIYQYVRAGIARTFQTPRVFDDLSVLENVMVPLLNAGTSTEEARRDAQEKLRRVDLTHVQEQPAKSISGGQKKLLEFARMLTLEPEVVMLDEPFAGVHPELKTTMRDQIGALRSEGVGFVIVSHEVSSLYDISDRVLVLDRGSLIAEGSPQEVQDDERVIEAYLGGSR